jgi:hypothetical protein
MMSPPARPPKGAPSGPHPAFRSRPQRLWPCQLHHGDGAAAGTAWVHHLSARGVSLFADFAPSQEGPVEVLLVNLQATFALRQPLTISRCDRLAGGTWFVAGTFPEPLRPDEIRPFLT